MASLKKVDENYSSDKARSDTLSGPVTPLRVILFSVGALSLGLGIAGVILPVLPTTPFMLLSAFCFMRSSRRVYFWMLNNRIFGKILRDYRNKEGLPLVIKIGTLILLWGTLALSAFVFIDRWFVRLILAGVGVGVTIHICWIKTKKGDKICKQKDSLQ